MGPGWVMALDDCKQSIGLGSCPGRQRDGTYELRTFFLVFQRGQAGAIVALLRLPLPPRSWQAFPKLLQEFPIALR